jgi:hypothetical protein
MDGLEKNIIQHKYLRIFNLIVVVHVIYFSLERIKH